MRGKESQDLKQGGEVKKECFRDNMCEGLEEREKDTTVSRTNRTGTQCVCRGGLGELKLEEYMKTVCSS